MFLDKMQYLLNKYPLVSLTCIFAVMLLGPGLIEVIL